MGKHLCSKECSVPCPSLQTSRLLMPGAPVLGRLALASPWGGLVCQVFLWAAGSGVWKAAA